MAIKTNFNLDEVLNKNAVKACQLSFCIEIIVACRRIISTLNIISNKMASTMIVLLECHPSFALCSNFIESSNWKLKQVNSNEIWFQIRGGVESNEFRIDFYRICRIIFHLQIINFRIESNKFRTNSGSEKFDSIL